MRHAALSAAALAMLAAACTIVNGLTVPSLSEAEEAGVDGGTDADAAPIDPCPHAYAIGRAGSDGPSKPLFVSALNTIDIGTTRDGGVPKRIGFDLDMTCSCQFGAPLTCKSSLNKDPDGGCDQAGGTDNAATALFQRAIDLSNGSIKLEEDLQNALANGAPGVLLWVGDYNGEADDPSVQVALTISPGTISGDKPTFDAGEAWYGGDDTQRLNGDAGYGPSIYLPQGASYVRNHQLIAQGSLTLPLLAGLTVHLSQGWLVGDISQLATGEYYISKGTVTGRAPRDEVIRSIGGIEKPAGSGNHLCEDTSPLGTFAVLKQFVCAAPDIMVNPAQDRTGAECDAISMGVEFTAVSAVVADKKPLDSVTYCADADTSCPPSE